MTDQIEKLLQKDLPPRLYKVGDLMDATGLSRQTIHNYTMMGLIRPSTRSAAGHRLYDEMAVKRLLRVMLLRVHRTMEEVKRQIDEEFGPAEQGAESEA